MSSGRNPVFRMFKPSGRTKEENAEKRKEQVRRAQNVYRQRKTRYVKALEGDLAASRRRETEMTIRQFNLEGQMKVLLHLLEKHSIGIPDLPVTSPGGDDYALDKTPSEYAPDAHLAWPQAWNNCSPLPSISGAEISDPILSLLVRQYDQTTIGMQFVLKIEEPCLGHVHGDTEKPEDPSNHALTVTSQLLCISSTSAPETSSLLPVQNVPSAILDRLLVLAPAVSGDDELTPIQAWDKLCRQPATGSLTLKTVMTLAETLRDTAKCHGFGAVLDVGVYNHLVGELMKSSISSHLSATLG